MLVLVVRSGGAESWVGFAEQRPAITKPPDGVLKSWLVLISRIMPSNPPPIMNVAKVVAAIGAALPRRPSDRHHRKTIAGCSRLPADSPTK